MSSTESRSASAVVSPATARLRRRIWATAAAALVLAFAAVLAVLFHPPGPPPIPYFSIETEMSKVRPALPYRIVSFHRGRADKNLIRLAHQLGFNGVQFQIEGSNEEGIKAFAARDRKEHLIDFCHSLGMRVTAWVHELSDLPDIISPDYLGEVAVDNDRLWNAIGRRYEWILGTAIPQIDGLVLTTVETQVRATDTPIMTKLVSVIDRQCRQHGKQLIVRTFVWRPEELEGVMGTVKQLPEDIVIMSKVVPQDWQMRGGNAMEIGAVGGRPQIVEYDAAGEYFLSDNVANCMVDLLKKQFDYGISRNVQGICVRVDRYDASVLWGPNEVNLWTLGLLSAGVTDDADDIWNRWATYRYGPQAASAVIAALQPTSQVVAEMLSLGPFTFGDTRGAYVHGQPSYDVPEPYDDVLTQNWQMWHWDEQYLPTLNKAIVGDPLFLDSLRKQKAAALKVADQCLADIERAKPLLPDKEYRILQAKLLTNRIQLEFRTQAAIAAMHYRQMFIASTQGTQAQFNNAAAQYRKDLDAVRALADSLRKFPQARTLNYLGKRWQVDCPSAISTQELSDWALLAAQVIEPRAR